MATHVAWNRRHLPWSMLTSERQLDVDRDLENACLTNRKSPMYDKIRLDGRLTEVVGVGVGVPSDGGKHAK
jgi:hypothetical protein